ncbi:Ger(x)C family spore germination protein [Desulfosporosinus nitroreducens]|uniref:Ger(X)C family spore germination protein n=1 Tax=Desulfosporosinus nitroreducens TaxID=2018668 RepID=A0ABT8QTD4_9FIRM|nr:Ger(x)C family spore germination protein [Desulfosporosinus nitroreducens]MDO0824619.1 Ger(x)C family spore germination protein [Desulfosporosinus nitroreducens]
MRKFALIMVCIAFLTTGCWDYEEVDRLATVLALGVDRLPGSKSILVTVQIPTSEKNGSRKQSGGQGGGKSYMILNSEGKSLSEAISYLGIQSARRILLSHCKTIVLGKEFAETGIGEILDELKRDKEFRRSDWIVITDKTAKEILEKDIEMEQVPARGLDHILQIFEKVGNVTPMNFNDFFVRLNGDSRVSFAPLVQLEDIDKRVTNQLEKVAGKPLDSEKKPKTLIIGKTAVFKNLQMVGVLNEEESKVHRWFVDTPKGTIIALSYTPEGQNNGETGEILVDILEGKTAIVPQISEDGIMMNINMKANLLLHETGATGLKVLDPKELEQLELEVANAINLLLEKMIHKAQKELNSDCIDFAENIHNYFPVEWKQIKPNWDNTFPTVDYHVSSEIKIIGTGLINNPTLYSGPED